jgi:hypothetical protein
MVHRRRWHRRRRADSGFITSAIIAGLVLAYAAGHHQVPAGGGSRGTVTAGAATSTAHGNAALGKTMAAASPYGWGGGQWDCLNWLWTRESGWSDTAANPTSDARGIAQDINGWSSAYPYGDAAAQIRWGLAYIADRYGTPCAAWSHETAAGWY